MKDGYIGTGYFIDDVLCNEYCRICEGKLSYSEKHDSFYCKKCDIWQIETCVDSDCSYCKNRPAKPSEEIKG